MKEIHNQDEGGDAFGSNLDPPLKEERKKKDPDQAFTSQSGPRALWFGLTKRGTCSCKDTRSKREPYCKNGIEKECNNVKVKPY